MTETLLERVLRHEGFESKPYKDSRGVLTIGHGLTFLTEIESGIIVENRLDHIGGRLLKMHPWISRIERTILEVTSEMVFQLGWEGCHRFKKMWAALEDKNYGLAANEMIDSEWHKQTKNRCEELAGIIRGLA